LFSLGLLLAIVSAGRHLRSSRWPSGFFPTGRDRYPRHRQKPGEPKPRHDQGARSFILQESRRYLTIAEIAGSNIDRLLLLNEIPLRNLCNRASRRDRSCDAGLISDHVYAVTPALTGATHTPIKPDRSASTSWTATITGTPYGRRRQP
jgi:hypothetical protein